MRSWLAVAAIAAVGCAPGSSDESGEPDVAGDGGTDCVDRDGDGAGFGRDCAADDCDDTDPTTTDECGLECDTNPQRRGCPCGGQELRACYHGPDGTSGVGRCTEGTQVCEDGVLGECHEQVLPSEELCDEADNDCNGEVDEGVLSECGTCMPCQDHCAGPGDGCEPFDLEEEAAHLVETPEGYLTLEGSSSSLHVIWPSSSATGQILRVNTLTYDVEAAFYTGPRHVGLAIFSGDSPSRTAVDDLGNVIVANRGFGEMSSITKVSASSDDCPDRNQNGSIETSGGWSDVLPFDSHDGWEDECILWHTVVGDGEDAIARAVAIHGIAELDAAPVERGWVGMYGEQRFLQFDTETGELTGVEAPTPGLSPYGAAVDREGFLWFTAMTSAVGRVDTTDPEDSLVTFMLPQGDGAMRVIVDENDAPWISGNDLFRFDRDRDVFEAVGLVPGPSSTTGMMGGLASDGRGSIWVGTYTDDELVYRVSNDDDLEWHTIPTPGTATFGMAADFEGQAWTFGYNDGTATVIDVETEQTQRVLADCGGAACLSAPYVRGDITGLQRRNALDPNGRWGRAWGGCTEGDTDWQRIVVDADTPAGSSIVVVARTGDDVADLSALPWLPVGTVPEDGTELDLAAALARAGQESGRYLEVEITLRSDDRRTAPVLRGLHVQWSCPGSVD
ncbi:MAG: hypothetical protein HYY06_10405 [Deltaproteobacteria bacterium]|nr:hypothetical protein [Deltaproteobacteria bacterium]